MKINRPNNSNPSDSKRVDNSDLNNLLRKANELAKTKDTDEVSEESIKEFYGESRNKGSGIGIMYGMISIIFFILFLHKINVDYKKTNKEIPLIHFGLNRCENLLHEGVGIDVNLVKLFDESTNEINTVYLRLKQKSS